MVSALKIAQRPRFQLYVAERCQGKSWLPAPKDPARSHWQGPGMQRPRVRAARFGQLTRVTDQQEFDEVVI